MPRVNRKQKAVNMNVHTKSGDLNRSRKASVIAYPVAG
jgi:hypothetical protein